jgi:hypothetical protein
MTDLYLIAHKVRGLPAFDVAQQILCPECIQPDASNAGCVECDGLGYWWVIPTSGHRAYPSDHYPLNGCLDGCGDRVIEHLALPSDASPDHYTVRSAPKVSLIEALGLAKPKLPSAPIVRRF